VLQCVWRVGEGQWAHTISADSNRREGLATNCRQSKVISMSSLAYHRTLSPTHKHWPGHFLKWHGQCSLGVGGSPATLCTVGPPYASMSKWNFRKELPLGFAPPPPHSGNVHTHSGLMFDLHLFQLLNFVYFMRQLGFYFILFLCFPLYFVSAETRWSSCGGVVVTKSSVGFVGFCVDLLESCRVGF
jgi:hypothetical protein